MKIPLDKWENVCYNCIAFDGRLAQLGEHLPYKQRVTGSSPVLSTIYGLVAQLVRALACHARGRGFEPHPSRHFKFIFLADLAHLVERHLAKVEVAGSSPVIRSKKPRKKFRGFFIQVADLVYH